MDQHGDHDELIGGFFKEQEEIFKSSGQAVYAYLDDENRVCNAKFAKLLGYSSPEEWSNVDVHGSFPGVFVAGKSQKALVSAYQDAMENLKATTVKITWKKKSGDTVDTTVILTPLVYKGHLFALHFIS